MNKVSKQLNIDLTNRRTLVESLRDEQFKKGVEVGVRLGWFSKYILEHTDMSLDCIDPWEQNAELVNDWEETYVFCQKLLKDYIEEDRCRMIKDLSPQVTSEYKDETLDFIYIDGLHDYESVKEDLNAWWPKLKQKKLLCGHDYNPHKWPGVVQAVEEFCATKGLQRHLTGIVGNAIQSHTGDIDEYDGDEHTYVIIKK